MHGDEVMDKIYPPIVDPEIFAKVRAKEILEKFVLDSIITELKKPGQMDYIVQGPFGSTGIPDQSQLYVEHP